MSRAEGSRWLQVHGPGLNRGSIQCAKRLLRGAAPGPGERDPPEVLELMQRVTLIPVARRTLFGPRITIFAKDGRSVTRKAQAANSSGTSRRGAPHPARQCGHRHQRCAICRADRCLPPARRRSPDADFADNSPVSVNAREGRLRCRAFSHQVNCATATVQRPSFE